MYVAEGHSSDTATVIEWCRNIGLFENYEEISDLVSSVKSSGEVYFVPSFSGIQAPVNDEAAATGFAACGSGKLGLPRLSAVPAHVQGNWTIWFHARGRRSQPQRFPDATHRRFDTFGH